MPTEFELVKKQINESPFEFLYEIFKDVEKETKAKVGNKYFLWSEHYDNWIELIQPLLRIKPIDSLLIVRFIEFNKIMLWIQNCVYCGQYYSALRELRFLLEFTMKAHYLDGKYPRDTMESKIRKEQKLIGSKLIRKLSISAGHKQEFKVLYGKLSEYTHPTKEELAQLMAGDVGLHTTFTFNESMFNTCAGLTNRTVDSVFFIVLNKFPEVVNNIKNKDQLIQSLQQCECKFALECIQQ